MALWYYAGNKERLAHWQNIKSFAGQVRRVGYMFGSLEMVPDLVEDLSAPVPSDSSWLLKTSADVADFLYFFCDNIPFLHDFGLVTSVSKDTCDLLYDVWGTRFWFVSCSAHVLLARRALASAQARHASADDISRARLRLVAALCNWCIGWFFLFPNRPFNSPSAGAMGALNALIGLWLKWEAAK